MAGKFHHEELYRGADCSQKLAAVQVTICGAGALGSHLAENLARQGFKLLKVIDCDRIEEHNISTQIYNEAEIGSWKAEILRNRLFRGTGVEIEALSKRLEAGNAGKLLKGAQFVLDTFDNSASRRRVRDECLAQKIPCLHAGMFEDYGEVVWNEKYRVPQDGGADVCDYPLARNLILLTVAVTAETLINRIVSGCSESWSITLRDFAIRPLEGRIE